MPKRNFLTIFSDDLIASKNWYVELLGYRVDFDSDWFVHLQDPQKPDIEVGLLSKTHELVPENYRQSHSGGMLTIVVDDVDEVYRRAEARGESILEAPKDLFYGQRRMLLTDPNGMLLDISSECPPDPKWLASLQS